MEVTTYSTHGNPLGVKVRKDDSRPGQRCVTYHEPSAIKTKKKSEK